METIEKNEAVPEEVINAQDGAHTEPETQMDQENEYRLETSPAVKDVLDSLSADRESKEDDGGNALSSKDEKPLLPVQEPEPAKTEEKKTHEQEEAEFMASLSGRGRERFRTMAAQNSQLRGEVSALRDMVSATGATAEQFAEAVEALRLINSPNEADRMVALKALDGIRNGLAMQLGVDSPGVDVLADFPELKAAVDNFEMPREYALEIVKARRANAERLSRVSAQQHQEQETRDFQSRIAQVSQASEAWFRTRENEVDFTEKMKRIQGYFSDPVKLQSFVTTYHPNQWLAQLQFMYDNIAVPLSPARSAQPIRSRAMAQGSPSREGMAARERLASIVADMGI